MHQLIVGNGEIEFRITRVVERDQQLRPLLARLQRDKSYDDM